MRKLVMLAVLLFLALTFSPAVMAERGIRGIIAVPDGALLNTYPIMNHPLTTREQVTFGLHPMALTKPWTGYNWYNGQQRFVLETLPVGTLVFADQANRPIYKADCSNRLVELVTDANTIATNHTSTGNSSSTSNATPTHKGNFLGGLWDFLKTCLGILLALLALLAMVALLILCAWGLYRLVNGAIEAGQNHQTPPAANPSTSPAPAPSGAETNPATGRVAPSAPDSPNPSSPAPKPTILPASAADKTNAPAPSQPQQSGNTGQVDHKFVAFYPGSSSGSSKLRFTGYQHASVEQNLQDDGSWETTIRFS